MICPRCQAKLASDVRFCNRCGAAQELPADTVEAPRPAEAPRAAPGWRPRASVIADVALAPPDDKPLDHGLVALGLLLRVGGEIGAILLGVLAATLTVIAVVVPAELKMTPDGPKVILLWLGVVRALLLRSVGSSLLFGSNLGPRGAARLYAVVTVVYSVVAVLLLGGPAVLGRGVLVLALGVGVPVLADNLVGLGLLAVFEILAARGDLESRSRATWGYGLEALPPLLSFFATIGLAVPVFLVVLVSAKPPAAILGGLVIVLALLALRTLLHALAVAAGWRGVDLEARAGAYARAGGVLSWVVAGVVMLSLLSTMKTASADPGWVTALAVCNLLILTAAVGLAFSIWPRQVGRLLAERQAGAWLETRPDVGAAPAGGLAGFGWLLLLLGLMALGSCLMGLVAEWAPAASLGLPALSVLPQLWAQALVGVLGVWAGLELALATSARWRIPVLAYGAVAAVLGAVTFAPLFPGLLRIAGGLTADAEGPFGAVMSVAPLASALVHLAAPVLAVVYAVRGEREAT